MGRRAKFDRDQAVNRVLQEVWKRGFAACSVKFLAEMLGITRSSFYNAFGNREALFREVLERYFDTAPERALLTLDANSRVLFLLTEVFRDICRARAADSEARGCLITNGVTELVGVNESFGPVFAAIVLDGVQAMERLLRQAADHGEMTDDGDLEQKALALQAYMMGLNVTSMVARSEQELWLATRQVLMGLGVYDADADLGTVEISVG